MILATGRPARKDDYTTMPGPLGDAVRDDRMVATVGVPIVVDGVIWGFMVVAGRPGETIPPDTEQRLARFTELVATAVSNATMRGELVASRARVMAAADAARRRIERDLHDGAQQRLVTLAVELRNVEAQVPPGQDVLRAEVSRLAGGMVTALDELREMSQGIHPANLSKAGLPAALEGACVAARPCRRARRPCRATASRSRRDRRVLHRFGSANQRVEAFEGRRVFGSTLAWRTERFASRSAMKALAERIHVGARGSSA